MYSIVPAFSKWGVLLGRFHLACIYRSVIKTLTSYRTYLERGTERAASFRTLRNADTYFFNMQYGPFPKFLYKFLWCILHYMISSQTGNCCMYLNILILYLYFSSLLSFFLTLSPSLSLYQSIYLSISIYLCLYLSICLSF